MVLIGCSEENARLKEMVKDQKEKEKNGSATTNSGNDMENCAILGVHLPQPTEYEYLRNILLEFMMGREPLVSWSIYFFYCLIHKQRDTVASL